MKRTINKLLEKLFGLTLIRVKTYRHLIDAFDININGDRRYTAYLARFMEKPCYEVRGFNIDIHAAGSADIIIKRFYYSPGDWEGRDYALLCAQELCDKLNEEQC